MDKDTTALPHTIEIVGVPGSGKSTLALALTEQEGAKIRKKPSHAKVAPLTGISLSIQSSWLKKRAAGLFLFVLRFRPLNAAIVNIVALWQFRALVAYALRETFRTKREGVPFPIKDILHCVRVAVRQQILSTGKAIATDRVHIVDGGYVQNALSSMLRAPHRHQDSVWREYLKGVPLNHCWLLLDVEPKRALSRFRERDDTRSAEKMSQYMSNATGGKYTSPEELWREMAEKLDEAEQTVGRAVVVDGNGTPEDVLNEAKTKIAEAFAPPTMVEQYGQISKQSRNQ